MGRAAFEDLGGAHACTVVITVLEEDPHRRSLSRPGHAAFEDLGGATANTA
jgi:hypothetical protein